MELQSGGELDNSVLLIINSFLRHFQSVLSKVFQIGLDLSKASLVCSIRSLAALPAMIFYGYMSDVIIRKNYVSKPIARRIFHGIGKLHF